MSTDTLEADAQSTNSRKQINEAKRDRTVSGALLISKLPEDPHCEIGWTTVTAHITSDRTIRDGQNRSSLARGQPRPLAKMVETVVVLLRLLHESPAIHWVIF